MRLTCAATLPLIGLLAGCYHGPPKVSTTPVAAPRVVTFDVAAMQPGSYTIPRWQPPVDSLAVVNLVPGKAYDVSFAVSARAIPPLNAPDASGGGPARAAAVLERTTTLGGKPCTDTKKALKALAEQTTEIATAKQIALIESTGLAEVASETCTTEQLTTFEMAIRTLTRRAFAIGELATNQDLVVRVTRSGDESGSTLTWQTTYAGQDVGDWRMLYGFLFVANAWPYYSYFTTQDGDQFEIKRQRSRAFLAPIPSIQYVFHRDPSANRHWWDHIGTPVAGLGFDLTKWSAHLGVIWVYHENVGVSTGVALSQVRDLNDKYRVGDRVSANLDNDQLTQDTFRANPFIAVSFRFGSTPFSPPPATPVKP
jgi:hypothetical protein